MAVVTRTLLSLCCCLLLGIPIAAAAPDERKQPLPSRFPVKVVKRDSNPSLTNVRASFDAIHAQGQKLGYTSGPLTWANGVYEVMAVSPFGGISSMSSPSHWEGMGRLENRPFLVVSSNDKGELVLVDMSSRAASANGAGRFGSNRTTSSNEPPLSDAVVAVNGQPTLPIGPLGPVPGYTHLGGLSVIGNIVFVGLEKEGDSNTDGYVFAVDFTTPTAPRVVGPPLHNPKNSAGSVAIAKRPDGTFLMAIGGWSSRTVDFYTSPALDPRGFQHAREVVTRDWNGKKSECVNNVDKDKTCFAAHQNLTFITQTDGKLFMLGTNRDGSGDDFIDLFEVSPSFTITKIAKKHMFCTDGCNFNAAAGAFVNGATQEIYVYSTEWRRSTTDRRALVNKSPLWTRFNEL